MGDERAWPVYAVFSLFMLYCGASSYLLFDWNHQAWYYNAQVYIAVSVVVWAVGLATIPLLERSSVRRGIQLSMVLSLIIHLSMFLGMVVIDIGEVTDTGLNNNATKLPERKPVVIPDYSPAQIEQDREQQHDYEQPVETKQAEAELAPVEQEQIEHEQPEMRQEEVETHSEIQREAIERREQAQDLPATESLANLPSRLSKQATEMQPREMTPIESPSAEQPEEVAPQISAAETSAEKQAQALEMARRAANVEAEMQRAAELQRRSQPLDFPSLSTSQAAELARQQNALNLPSRSQADAIEAARQAATQVNPQAQAESLARQTQSDLSQRPQTQDLASSMSRAPLPALERNRLTGQPQIAPSASASEMVRQRRSASIPSTNAEAESTAGLQPRSSASPQLQAANSGVMRRETCGDGVAANAVNPGQLWARPGGGGPSAALEMQEMARQNRFGASDTIDVNPSDAASLSRNRDAGSNDLAAPSVKIEFMGSMDLREAAAQAEALADGQVSSPELSMGRGAGSQGEIGRRANVGSEVGPSLENLASSLAGMERANSAAQGGLPDLAPATETLSGISIGRESRSGPQVETSASTSGQVDPAVRSAFSGGMDQLSGVGEVPGINRRSPAGEALPTARPGAADLAGAPRPIQPGGGFIGRRSTAEASQIETRVANLPSRSTLRSGPLLNTKAAVPTQAFRRRAMRKGEGSGDESIRPSRKTEEAIERGLEFLARHQSADGRWSLRGFSTVEPKNFPLYQDELPTLNSDAAATGLALLAFFGAGYDHLSDKYQEQVKAGVEFLVKNQRESGDLYIPADGDSNASCQLYSHGIAALALCEAYGMTQDPDLRFPAQRSLDFIATSQDPNLGGWRYSPRYGSDTSVTGWMTMALKSGQLAGLKVDQQTFRGIQRWIDSAETRQNGRAVYVYNPFAPNTPEQRHGRRPTRTMTAVGALIQLYLGNRRDSRTLQDSAAVLKQNLPTHGTVRDPQRDTYYWYYATQVMFHMRGEYWEAWDNELHVLLEDTQIVTGPSAGSWDPKGDIPDRWGGFAGRLYVTTMNLLSLEVYHRHLPLYEDTAR